MSNIDKQALREVAEKATPGRWEYYPGNTSIEYNVDSMDEDQGSIVYVDSGDFTQKQTDLNGAFIAASNPTTVLALLDELEAKDKSISFLKDQLAQLANFNPDWDKLEAATYSLREHMAELTAARKRIAELEAREVKLPELKMLSDYLAEVTMHEREDILVGVRLEFFRALKEAGIKVAAAAGKGEAL